LRQIGAVIGHRGTRHVDLLRGRLELPLRHAHGGIVNFHLF